MSRAAERWTAEAITRLDVRPGPVVLEVADRLAAAGVSTPEVDAALLVDHVAEAAGDAGRTGRALLDRLVERRADREPLQLLTGRTWFRLLELACVSGVFIPRPETEVVAGLAIEAARDVERPTVVDVCCGGGAIALSVAVEVPGARVVAADLDDRAVSLTRENLERVVEGRAGVTGLAAGAGVTVTTSDLLDGIDAALRGHLHVLVANPPYLPARDRGTWEPEVADHDPPHALVGGPDGHEVVDALLEAAATWLGPGGTVVLEIDERRGDDAAAAATAAGLVGVRIEPDLTGASRAVVARRPAG